MEATIICAGITGVCTVICAAISAASSKRAKKQSLELADAKKAQDEAAANKAGTLALLHDRLYQACNYYIVRGWITSSDLENLKYMFNPYQALGGNGTCKILYERCQKLDIKPDGFTEG